MKKSFILTFILTSLLSLTYLSAEACTGIRLIAKNGGVVYGRSMEWGAFDLNSRVAIIPRGYKTVGLTPDGNNGKTYVAKYAVVGLDALGKDMIMDGMNEKGLAAGTFYHLNYAEYPEYNKKNAKNCVSSQEMLNYLLSQFATIEEVKEGMPKVDVVGVVEEALGITVQVHWIVTDQSGVSVVIEYKDGKIMIHDAPLGVITNNPYYCWHVTNLSNYIKLSPLPAKPLTLNGVKVAPLGAGSGMLGIPGDFTPPSRFVRAVAWTQTARPTEVAKETVYEAFRILDNFNLPLGPDGAEGSSHDAKTELMRSSTIWTTVWNLEDLVLNYHTQHNRRVRQVHLKEIDFDKLKGDIVHITLDDMKEQDVKDKTPKNL